MTSSGPILRHRIAIVGAGITGAVAATELAKLAASKARTSSSSKESQRDEQLFQIVVFDQGRRGPGGRASHRSVSISTGEVLPDDAENIEKYFSEDSGTNNDEGKTYQFDHGCQFFRADNRLMREDLLKPWLSRGWVEPWKARLGCLSPRGTASDTTGSADFFGVPSKLSKDNDDVFISLGGMHLLPRRILDGCKRNVDGNDGSRDNNSNNSNSIKIRDGNGGSSDSNSNGNNINSGTALEKNCLIEVHRGTRVQSVRRNDESNKWDLCVVSGTAAYHDTKQENISSSDGNIFHCNFDSVVFTDISSSSAAWHRASAGIPDSFRSKLPPKIRIPLFSCMVALKTPIGQCLPFDAFAAQHDKLWFAAKQPSPSSMECWTLISTPSFAANEIQSTTMRDEKTGEFLPQENSYLNTIPGPELANSFIDLVRPYVEESQGTDGQLEIVYLQAQRWGSGLPAPNSIVKTSVEVCGSVYASELLTSSLVYETSSSAADPRQPENDFIADDAEQLYYAGDFCSYRNPGFEAAALSGLNVARHIMRNIASK